MHEEDSLDPLGHITIATSNIEKSRLFYKKIFKILDFKKISDEKDSVAWVTKNGLGIWITQARHQTPSYKFHSPGLHHICFKARSEDEVDNLYNFLIDEGVYIYDAPKHYPKYTEKYYAVFFADPDGIKLELAYY